MQFRLSDVKELTLPIRRAVESVRAYVDAKVFPPLTSTERDDRDWEAGDTCFNTTTNKHQGYNGTTWNDLY